jgi:hypothetical protein
MKSKCSDTVLMIKIQSPIVTLNFINNFSDTLISNRMKNAREVNEIYDTIKEKESTWILGHLI